MKVSELSEEKKKYNLILNNKSEYMVTGAQKNSIIKSRLNFVVLPDGSIINKSYIVEFKLNYEETKSDYLKNSKRLASGEGEIIT